MKSTIAALTATIALTLPAYAAGDAENGEKEFRKCKVCHMIQSPAGPPPGGPHCPYVQVIHFT